MKNISNKSNKLYLTAAGTIMFLVMLITPVPSAGQAVTNTTVTYDPFTWLLTPNDFPCLEENILLEGTLHIVEHTTVNEAGGRNTRIFANAPNLLAYGESSQTIYRATGPTHISINDNDLTAPPRVRTVLDVLHIIGPGESTDLFAWILLHVTRDESGQIRSSTTLQRVECR